MLQSLKMNPGAHLGVREEQKKFKNEKEIGKEKGKAEQKGRDKKGRDKKGRK